MKTKDLIAILLLSYFVLSCEKDDLNVGKGVEFYLLDEWENLDEGNFVDPSSNIVVQKVPFIYYSDIISYDPSTYTFEMTDEIYKRFTEINEWHGDFLGEPFVLRVDGDDVYIGRFWREVFESQVGDTGLYALKEENKFQARIFRSSTSGLIAEDKRNDPQILNILRRDGKLIE